MVYSLCVDTFLWHQSLATTFTVKFLTVFKLCRYRVNASSNFATVTFFTVFKMCRYRVNAVVGTYYKEINNNDDNSNIFTYLSQDSFVEELLQLFIAVINAKLLKAVDFEEF